MKNFEFTCTEITEAINGLEIMLLFLNKVEDLYSWKWVIISCHNSIQNFMTTALSLGNNFEVINEQSKKQVFDEINEREYKPIEEWKMVDEKMDYFFNLYKKIKSEKMERTFVGKRFNASFSNDQAIKWLVWHRNEFIHFVPKTFTFNTIEFPRRLLSIMEIIKFLVTTSYTIVWTSTEEKKKTEVLIDKIIVKLRDYNKYYIKEGEILKLLNLRTPVTVS